MITSRKKLTSLTVALSVVTCFGFTAVAGATGDSRVQAIITAGDAKIATRLTALNDASSKLSAMTHVTATNKTTLQNEITSTISGLNAQKATLDAATTAADATTARNAIFTDYRVYAVVLPKVRLVKVADDQLTNEANLTTFANKLSAKASGNSQVADMQSKISAAQALSSAAETKVLAVDPSDYNTDHTVLSQNLANLKQAHADNQAAYQEGLAVMKSLK